MRNATSLIFVGFGVALGWGCGGSTAEVPDNGDAGSSDGGTAGTCTDGACISGELDWGANGGLVSSVDSSSVSSCTSYVHSRSASGSGSQLSCTDTLGTSCSTSTVGAAELASAVRNADVVAAFANAGTTKVYGGDSRPCDGSVLEVTYGGKTIDIGSDSCENCGGSTGCIAVPTGLRALANTLDALDQQELKTPSCKSAFGL